MKLIKINSKSLKLSPKRLFGSSKSRNSVSKSDPSSYSLGSSSSSSDASQNHKTALDLGTPTSVLPETSAVWSDASTDKDTGVVSREDLEAFFSRLGAKPMSREEVAAMLREVGCGDDEEYLSIDELMSRAGGLSACEAAGSDELRETFEFFDADRDGRITAEELMSVFMALGDERCTLEDCKRMIAGVDKNRDGFVCFEDFCVMMEHQR